MDEQPVQGSAIPWYASEWLPAGVLAGVGFPAAVAVAAFDGQLRMMAVGALIGFLLAGLFHAAGLPWRQTVGAWGIPGVTVPAMPFIVVLAAHDSAPSDFALGLLIILAAWFAAARPAFTMRRGGF